MTSQLISSLLCASQVKWHVANYLNMPDLKFFVKETIPEDFEHDGQSFVLSYYLLPPRRPVPVKAHA
eukprot:1141174-Pelagomonas_calceolata.AAC.1